MSRTVFSRPEIISRAGVTVHRDGWIDTKSTDTLIGKVTQTAPSSGKWQALSACGEWRSYWEDRDSAITAVIEFHNRAEKAKCYDREQIKAGGAGSE